MSGGGSGPRRGPVRRAVLWATLVAVLLLVVIAAYGVVEARTLTVAEYTFSSPAVPAAFDGLLVAFLSDIHHGRFVSRERVAEVVDRVNDLGPDVVLLGGDYVYGKRRYIRPCFEELSRLEAPLGVYGVLGNHDHYEGAGQTRREMAAAGVRDLTDAGYWVERGGERLRLGGVDDMLEGWPDLEYALDGTRVEDFVLLVSHNPDYAGEVPPDLPADTVDLMLSGHTHGGQVTLFGLWAPVVPSDYGRRYRTGLVTEGPFPVVVSNGIGTIPPPVRLFAPPQITVVELRREG